MQAFRTTVVAAATLWAGLLGAQAPAIRAVVPAAPEVPCFGKLELSVDIAGTWANPYDPDQVDVTAEFTSPSGKTVAVPGFWYQEHRLTVLTAAEARRQVALLKLFIEEKGTWGQHPTAEFLIDDVELRAAGTGRAVPLDDFEGPESHWGPTRWAVPTDELAHGGKRALRFQAEIGGVEDWPGTVLSPNGADWSAYDGMSFWIYPRVAAPFGPVQLYLSDTLSGNSPIARWQVGSDELKPNQWNHLTWDWRPWPTRGAWEPQGPGGWRVRFCPTEVGEWTYRVRVRDQAGSAVSEPGRCRCVPSASPGFVRVSAADPHYLDFDNGTAFVPIGHDVAWGVADTLTLFPKLHAAGENVTYFIMVAGDTHIEWNTLGEYDLEAAAKLDSMIDAAEQNDIYVKLSFDIHDALRVNGRWEQNPYSAKHGGPCASPNDLYTLPAARQYYHRRLRYIAARWGYSTHLMAWEPVAEIDGGVERQGEAGWAYPGKPGGEAVTALLIPFLKDTAATLRQVCPYERLFTTSFGGDVSDPAIWALPEIQYTQLHHYDSVDVGRTLPDWCQRLTTAHAKPLMVTECGWWADWTKPFLDRDGVCQHNAIWASLLGGAAGAAQSWWWEHIDEWNLYPHYAALRRFVEGVDFPREGFRPAAVTTQVPPGGECGPLSLPGSAPLGGATVAEFTVRPDGSVTEAAAVPGFLLAPGRSEPRVSPVFHLNCPQDGSFGLHVEAVSPDAELTVFVDGQPVLTRDLPAQNVPGKLCTFSERWQLWQCRYDEDITVPVSAGPHEVRLENTKPGISWIRVTAYELSNYTPPTLRVVGLQGKRQTLLWLQNPQHTWINAIRGRKPAPIQGATLELHGLADAEYEVAWWDTYQGRCVSTAPQTPQGGTLRLTVPPVDKDLACRVVRRG